MEFDYQRVSTMSCIEAFPKSLSDDDQLRLAAVQEQP